MLCRFYFLPRYEKKMEKYAPLPVPPEERLAEVMLALPLLTVSYAWFAATASPDISFWVPMMSGLLQGSAIQLVFTGFQSYLGDACTSLSFCLEHLLLTRSHRYEVRCDSVGYLDHHPGSSCRFLPSCVAPSSVCDCADTRTVFLPQLYREIGPRYAGTLLTCLMAVLAPTPFLLYRYGGRLRAKSRFANSSK